MIDPMIGKNLGHFVIQELIAEGGMGVIYRASHDVIGKQAAIKVLSEKYSQDMNMIKRLHREARAVNRIGHPNIIDIFDFGRTEDGCEYFIMEYVPGQSLSRILEQRGRLHWDFIQPVLTQTLDALMAVHELGFIHRDIKPENILVVEHEHGKVWIKLLDFGIARSMEMGPDGESLTSAGTVMGTPEYVSPEQINGKKVDGRADLYALGVMLFEFVMGCRPFESDELIGLLMAHLKSPIPTVRDIPPELEIPSCVPAVITRAMAKDPDDRFPNASVFAASLGIELTTDGPPSGIYPPLSDEEMGPVVDDPEAITTPIRPPVPPPCPPPQSTLPAPAPAPAPHLPTTSAMARSPSRLRLLIPLLLILVSGSAIGLFFALKGRVRQDVLSAPPDKGLSAPSPKKEMDLHALYERVRRALRKGVLHPSDVEVRRVSTKGVGELGDREALALLASVLRDDPDRSTRSVACMAIARLGDPAGARHLRDARARSDEKMRVWLDEGLMKLQQDDGLENLRSALKSSDKEVRFQASLALGEAGLRIALPVLKGVVSEAANLDRQTVIAVLGTMAKLGHEDSLRSLNKALKGPDLVLSLGAAEALVRLGDDRPVPRLKEMLAGTDTRAGLLAARLLARLGDFSGVRKLTKAARAKDTAVRRLGTEGLGSVDDRVVFPVLAQNLEDSSWLVKAAAAEALARILSLMPTALVRRSQDWIKTALANRDWTVRNAAAGLTSEMDPELAVNLLGWALADKDPRIRTTAVSSLGKLRSAKAVPLLTLALSDSSADVRQQAAGALGQVKDDAASRALHSAVRDRSPLVGVTAAGSLLAQGDTSYLKDLQNAAKARSTRLRQSAVAALGQWQDPAADSMLTTALQDPAPLVRFAAAEQLAQRGKKTPQVVAALRRALAKGGPRQKRAMDALSALGVDTTAEIQRLAHSKKLESRRDSMASASRMPEGKALALLKRGLSDADPQVRLAAAGSLAVMARKSGRALSLLEALSNDPNPLVRSRASLGLARIRRSRSVPDTGTVKPVKQAPLPEPRKPQVVPRSTHKPLFVEDTDKHKLYKYHISQASVATSRGRYHRALDHLEKAKHNIDRPPLLFEFGYVNLKLTLKHLASNPPQAKKYLGQAKKYFRQYLKRAPRGKQAPRARSGLKDVKRLDKQLR